MKIFVNNNVYTSEDKQLINNIMETAKEAMGKCNFYIYALETKDYLEVRKDIFSSKRELLNMVTQLTRKGFKVHYISKGGK